MTFAHAVTGCLVRGIVKITSLFYSFVVSMIVTTSAAEKKKFCCNLTSVLKKSRSSNFLTVQRLVTLMSQFLNEFVIFLR